MVKKWQQTVGLWQEIFTVKRENNSLQENLIENFDGFKKEVPIKEIQSNKIPINTNNISNVIKDSCPKEKKSCTELVNKVLSCPICKKMVLDKLNLGNFPINFNFDSLLNGNNKELLILLLIGLIIIILLDLFLKISKSLN